MTKDLVVVVAAAIANPKRGRRVAFFLWLVFRPAKQEVGEGHPLERSGTHNPKMSGQN